MLYGKILFAVRVIVNTVWTECGVYECYSRAVHIVTTVDLLYFSNNPTPYL